MVNSLRRRVEQALRGEAPSSPRSFRFARSSVGMMAPVLVASFLGWGLDRLLGSTPFALILFFFLGLVAGVRTVYREATKKLGKGDHDGTS